MKKNGAYRLFETSVNGNVTFAALWRFTVPEKWLRNVVVAVLRYCCYAPVCHIGFVLWSD